MRRLNGQLDLGEFFERLERAPERILFVDYDGTLAPFAPRAERAVPYPGVAKILNDIAGGGSNAVVLVSGRNLADMQVPLAHIRATEVWASHGWQHARAGGPRIDYEPDLAQQELLGRADSDARSLEALGARVERKPGSVAVHWRGLDPITVEVIVGDLRCRWPAYERRGLDVLEFEAGIELRSPGRTKGHAVSDTLGARGDCAVSAYLGDDLTDEDAFRAMRGRGISALVRPQWRPTSADLWLTPPRDLIEFLKAWESRTRQ